MKCRVLKNGKCKITQEYNNIHQGVDIVGEDNKLDFITAQYDGKVVFFQDGFSNIKGSTGNVSYGNCVKIEHGSGYVTLYAHMQKGLKVKLGEEVKNGQVLGYMGDSGNAYGGHLHFEVWKDGVRINPIEYLDKDLYVRNKKSLDEIANDVVNGKYGNYPERKEKLEKEGYNYSEVQTRVNELVNKMFYLSNPNYTGYSIVDALNQIGVDSSYNYRFRLANVNGITNYVGSAEQNIRMLEMLRKGTLKSVVEWK